MCKEKLKKINNELDELEDEKTSKAIEENKLTVMVKILLWDFNLYWKFMSTDENSDKSKTNIPCYSIKASMFLVLFV